MLRQLDLVSQIKYFLIAIDRDEGSSSSSNLYFCLTDTLSDSESSLINEIIPSNSTLNINFKPIRCEDIEGPIYLKFVAVCQAWWCRSQEHNHVIISYNISLALYTVRNLTVYTNYTLTIAASRDRTDWSTIQTTDFTTKSSGGAIIISQQVTVIKMRIMNSRTEISGRAP